MDCFFFNYRNVTIILTRVNPIVELEKNLESLTMGVAGFGCKIMTFLILMMMAVGAVNWFIATLAYHLLIHLHKVAN